MMTNNSNTAAMSAGFNQQREVKCSRCGTTYTEIFIPFASKWIGECDCVIAEKKAEEEWREKCKRESKIAKHKKYSGIPKLYRNCSLENFNADANTERSANAARIYIERFRDFFDLGKGIIFTGNTGSGKTHLAAAIANNLLDDGYNVKFISFSNLIDSIKEADDYGATEGEIIRKYKNCDLLILDDICVTTVSDRWKNVLLSIVDYRTSNMKPTIFTSNIKNLDEIKYSFNEQIYDRISGNCVEIKVLANSYRQKKKNS